MKLHFLKFNPTENMTLLVTDPVPRELQGPLAARLMENRSIGAEQVGYLEKASLPGARARLQMMGGEFCGNASMCMAVFLTRDELPPEGEKAVEIEVSGAGRVKCALRREGPDFRCRVEMPLPREIRRVGDLTLVRLPGIAHFVSQYPVDQPEETLRSLARGLEEDAVGLMQYLPEKGLTPLVYVKDTDTMVWERGCGSGSAAVGAMLANEARGDVERRLPQPGGEIIVRSLWKVALCMLSIEGLVKIVCEGEACAEM